MRRTFLLLALAILSVANIGQAQANKTVYAKTSKDAKWALVADSKDRAAAVFRLIAADPEDARVSFRLRDDGSILIHISSSRTRRPIFLQGKRIMFDVCSSDEIHVTGPRLMDIHTLSMIDAAEDAVVSVGDYAAISIFVPGFTIGQTKYPELSVGLRFQ